MLHPKMVKPQGKIAEHRAGASTRKEAEREAASGRMAEAEAKAAGAGAREQDRIEAEGGRRAIVNRAPRKVTEDDAGGRFIIDQLAEQFLQEHAARKDIAPATGVYYERNLSHLLTFCHEVKITTPKALTTERVEQYIAWLQRRTTRQGKAVSPHTVHKSQRALRMFTKWAKRKGYMPADTGQEVDMVHFRQESSIKYLTEDQLARVLSVPRLKSAGGVRAYLAVYLLAATGIRQGELLGLTRADLLEKEHLLHVPAEISKSKRERFVPLPEEQRGAKITLAPELSGPLARYLLWRDRLGLGPEDALFVNGQGKPLSRYTLASMLRRIGEAAGVKLSARTFRHTCAVMLLKSSGDLKLVYDVLGHSTLEVTKQYLRFTPADIQARYRAAHHMGGVTVPTRKAPTMAEVDKAMRRTGRTERELSDLLFEVDLREG